MADTRPAYAVVLRTLGAASAVMIIGKPRKIILMPRYSPITHLAVSGLLSRRQMTRLALGLAVGALTFGALLAVLRGPGVIRRTVSRARHRRSGRRLEFRRTAGAGCAVVADGGHRFRRGTHLPAGERMGSGDSDQAVFLTLMHSCKR
jgi:hypothetical protein